MQDMQKEHEAELHDPLSYIGLFDNLYTEYATNFSAPFGGEERPEVIRKAIFPEKFSQNIPFSYKDFNKDQI